MRSLLYISGAYWRMPRQSPEGSCHLCRIIPRHKFWERLPGRSNKPLPLTYLTWSDAKFVETLAQRPLQEYVDFKARLWSGKPI